MIKTTNDKTVTVKLTRIELIKVMIACTTLADENSIYKKIHDDLRRQLDAFDKKLEANND